MNDILENQRDPAAAIAKKQQKLVDIETKYSNFFGGASDEAAEAADAPSAADIKAAEEADALVASVKAITGRDTL